MSSDRTKALEKQKLLAVPKQCEPPGVTDPQVLHAFDVRFEAATEDAQIPAQPHPRNGDEKMYSDKSGTYSKCLKQKAPGVVDPVAFAEFRKATGNIDPVVKGTMDFEVSGLLGGTRKLNGPQGAFALHLIGQDSSQFGAPAVPAAPSLATTAYGAELIELYWASLLRDVPFSEYESNPDAQAAAKELSGETTYAGPRAANGQVTPSLLFRGGLKTGNISYFAGETDGPYLSQFCILPTTLGALPIDQRYITYKPNLDYMTDLKTWFDVQQGISTGLKNETVMPPQYLHDGRGLAAATHVDELYQEYFIAYLVMNTLNVPPNPGSPYVAYKNQQPFGTFGGPDITATLAAVAKEALNAVWWQKWVVHLRHRPEAGGAVVDFINNPQDGMTEGKVNSNVLNSEAVKRSYGKYKTWFLSQAFPEGSPAHPAYPTGHGTVAGACITVLKFFFDGDFVITAPMMPAPGGLSLQPYTSAQGEPAMTVNGELHKLAHNISFGHGIHAGIHWRSDTDYSLLLGEAVALRYLRDQAKTHSEKFAISLTKIDGSKVTIENP